MARLFSLIHQARLRRGWGEWLQDFLIGMRREQRLLSAAFADIGSPLGDGNHQALIPEHLDGTAGRSPRDSVMADEV